MLQKNQKKLTVLLACEESQSELAAFRSLGHDAYSCDLQACSGLFPEFHFQCDVREIINLKKWDLIIAHPPCTYLSKAGATSLFRSGTIDYDRYKKLLAARDFFYFFYNLDFVPYVAIENPVPFKIANLPPISQIINPYNFGSPYMKRTCLWLKNLPPLMFSAECTSRKSFVYSRSGSKARSKSFDEISCAMADQWSNFILTDYARANII